MSFFSTAASGGSNKAGSGVSPRDDAIALLARREYSRAELERRLAGKGHDNEPIAECLDGLAQEGLQSDARFAEVFVRSYIARDQGPLKIRAKLDERGIKSDLVRSSLENSDVDWFSLACQALAKRFDDAGGTPRERARRERFLAGRGFDFDQTRHALSHAWDHH
ncbi:regulatory protein RecX [Halomonas sp. PR-M31]|uniref:regulatory protein RecX n=1 Tax=Halomonas sp. PR-M31 TaxID=1471202 RepID=UPI00065162C0|nr:regulatory protein RecX [Halomonas sp. PR-M31]